MGFVYFDVYLDIFKIIFGEKILNVMLFCLVIEEGLLDCEWVVVIGLWGFGNSLIDYEYGKNLVRI